MAVATRHPLQDRNFRLLCIGNAISRTGDQFYFVALPWLILQLTDSSIALGTITMLGAIPRAALMLIGGATTDQVSPRRVMLITASIRTVMVALIPVLIWSHALRVWHLYILAFAFGVVDAFAAPAAQVYLPSLVKREQLSAANSVVQSSNQFASLIVPAPAGFFIKAFGTAWALLLDAISFLGIIGALWHLPDRSRETAPEPQRNVLRSVLDGLRYVQRDVALRSLVIVEAALNFGVAGPISVGIPFMAKQRFGTPSSFGLLMSAAAAGGLLGTLLAGHSRRQRLGWHVLIIGVAVGLCLMLIGAANRFSSVVAALFISSGMAAFFNLELLTWLQQRVDPAMRGRVMSFEIFSSTGLIPFSLATAGFTITWSLSGTLIAAGVFVILVTSVATMQRAVREID
jgi:MFS family permease